MFILFDILVAIGCLIWGVNFCIHEEDYDANSDKSPKIQKLAILKRRKIAALNNTSLLILICIVMALFNGVVTLLVSPFVLFLFWERNMDINSYPK